MNIRRSLMLTLATLTAVAGEATAQHVVPSALLTIDQNRATVVERIVGEWSARLATSNAGITPAQLRQILSGLRSDHLLAASLAGSVEGLRDVVSGALVRRDAKISPTLKHTKSLGDTTDDLVYTPVVPCRIVDTRAGGGGVFLPGNQRDWLAYSPGGFAAQGGSATNCGIPVRPVAIMANTTLANTVGGPEFFVLWPFNQTRPNASTVNWWAPAQQPANAEIVPLCTGTCTSDFSAYASGQTNAIIDVLGYFNRPTNYGGTHTITGLYATDSGGLQNTASGDYSTVAGGFENIASGIESAVVGGVLNIASGDYSTVAGGNRNTASANFSAVAGGDFNNASGVVSTVAGGQSNIASGYNSFAAGYRAHATHDYSFVWGGDPAHDSLSQANNDFVVVATGAIRMYGGPFGGGGCILSNGNAGWQCASDRNLKENFVQVDTQEVLHRVSKLPITSWNSKAVPDVRHIGPMAQDFHALFGVGEDDIHIGTTDAQGVALAAIQGLHQMMRQKDAKLQQQSREISALKRKLLAIEAKLGI